ncbi:DNase I-like protein, partial [Rickenella mellea]
MHLYLKEAGDDPRTLFLVTQTEDELAGYPSRALVFRAVEGSSSQTIVEFLPKDQVDLSGAVRLTSRRVKGCMGLINIGDDIFLAVVLSATAVGNTRPSHSTSESVARIHEVGFYSISSATWDDFPLGEREALPDLAHPDTVNELVMREPYASQTPPPGAPAGVEHPCAPLVKILSSGTFYYATEPVWDLSSRMATRVGRERGEKPKDIASYDERFVWNEYIVRSLLDLRDRLDPLEREDMDRCQFIVLAIQGYVGVFTFPLPAPPTNGMPVIATISLISRLGWKRAGTRFNTRGIDDDGNCANFVETETIFSTDENCFSFVQIRGSVPLFWEQQGLQTFGQKIQITRPHASQPAFERHFSNLMEEYVAVHAINLLGTKENEAILSSAYAHHVHIARGVFGNDIGISHFDFHNVVRLVGHEGVVRELRHIDALRESLDKFGYTMYDPAFGELLSEQAGVFRTNCLDCLDRTNFVQDILSRMTLEQYLSIVRREWTMSSNLWSYHRELWAENGDALSRIYAGTGALNTSFTRSGKRTLAGVLSDATKSVSRAYINNFQDKGKQTAIDMFLGNLSNRKPVTIYDPIHDSVRAALERRLPEYSTTKQITIFIGTWNLNGRTPAESLLPWLCPRPGADHPDMFVLGFQEIVPLTAQQILQTDPEKRRIWERSITETLDRLPNKTSDYVLIRSEQLVGTALLVFVKSNVLGSIRNVEATTRKTGLRGMSGNKGAVGIRLDYHDTSFCFLTAHLAAGHGNVEERNADYRTIANGLHFQKGKTITSHENVIWLGDLNYRIDLENDIVRQLIERDELDTLVAADQLRSVIDAQEAFWGYEEGPILFRPTYRYDLNSEIYDTSEKMRIPAWTDRILYRGRHLDLSVYSRAELMCSDHRPVFGIFRSEIRIIEVVKRAALQRFLFDSVTSTAPGQKLDEKLAAMAFTEGPDDLPPPSSDEQAWWDDPNYPGGVFVVGAEVMFGQGVNFPPNPFDSPADSPLSSPSSSDEELYSHAQNLQAPITPMQSTRKPPPPPPRRSNRPISPVTQSNT